MIYTSGILCSRKIDGQSTLDRTSDPRIKDRDERECNPDHMVQQSARLYTTAVVGIHAHVDRSYYLASARRHCYRNGLDNLLIEALIGFTVLAVS